MALLGANCGANSHNSSATSFTLSTGQDFVAGAMGVLAIAADNAGASGAAMSTFGVTDTKGNTWTRRQSPLYDPGAASAGIEGAIFTTPQDGGTLTTADTITVSFGSTNVTAKAWALTQISSSIGGTVSYVTGGVNTGAASASPTVTSSAIASGDVIVGAGFAESGDTWAGDADTTNGSWQTHQHAAAGTGATGMSVTSQYKVVTAIGAQTYNPTLTSADVILAWVQLTETQPIKGVAAVRPFSSARVGGGGIAPNIPAGLKNEIGRPGPGLRALQRFVGLNRYERPGNASAAAVVTGSPWHYYAQQSRQAH